MRLISVGLLCSTLLAAFHSSTSQGALPPKLGTTSSEIGTFNGWTCWVGWEGSFSDSYEPVKEKYAWVVYFAPEAIYVALQPSQAVYSGVDVNMGVKYFYGFLKAPGTSQTLSANYIDNLWSVSLSIGYPDATPPVGIMAHFSLGFEIEQGFFRVENTRTILPGVQWGAGYSASYSLLPVSLPFTVELDRNWVAPPAKPAFSGFWPIVIWNRTVNQAQHPIDQLQAAVLDLGSNQGGPATATVMAGPLRTFFERVSADQDLRDFISNPSGSSRIRQAITATETWLVTSDTSKLPETLKPVQQPAEVKETVKPVLCITQMAFETGYRVGAEANPNNRTVYVDGVVTNYVYTGEKCTLEVPVAELLEVIPGRQAAEFEGTWIGFDVPLEGGDSYESIGQVEWVQMKQGVARYTIAQTLSNPQLLGVRYDDDSKKPLNDGRDVELKRRLILFLDPSDKDQNNIPDFWEDQYKLANRAPGADADGDGMTDYQEYLANTNPTNALDFLSLSLNKKDCELILPFTSNVRNYVIEANTNSIAKPASWINVMEFIGSDAEERIDLTEVFKEPKAFFRLRVSKP